MNTITGMLDELEELPEGFHKVSVLVTSSELENLKRVAAVTAEATASAAIRRALKWQEAPYGLKAALVRALQAKDDQ